MKRGRPKTVDYNVLDKEYNQALSDIKNAKRLGISATSVAIYRRLKGIKVNHKAGRPRKIDDNEFMKYYNLGYSNHKIADKLGVNPGTVCIYMHNKKIPSHFTRSNPGYNQKTRRDYVLKGYTPNDSDKPWKDPESLFCSDSSFLQKLKTGDVEL